MISNFTKFLFSTVLGVSLMWPATISAEKAVVVVSSDGAQTQVILGNVKRIDIGDASATVHHTQGSDEYAYGDIKHILIGAEWAAVQKILKEGDFAVWPTTTNGPVNAAGLADGRTLTVYSLAGSLVATATADSNGAASIDLSSCQSGVYIVSDGTNSVKIIKK